MNGISITLGCVPNEGSLNLAFQPDHIMGSSIGTIISMAETTLKDIPGIETSLPGFIPKDEINNF
jgi:hypothetical protein